MTRYFFSIEIINLTEVFIKFNLIFKCSTLRWQLPLIKAIIIKEQTTKITTNKKCFNQNQLNYKIFINVLVHLIRSIIICCSACAHIQSNIIKFNQILMSRLLFTSVMILLQFFINIKWNFDILFSWHPTDNMIFWCFNF